MNRFEVEENLRKVEALLEEIGRSINHLPASAKTDYHINKAINEVQEAIHNVYLIEF